MADQGAKTPQWELHSDNIVAHKHTTHKVCYDTGPAGFVQNCIRKMFRPMHFLPLFIKTLKHALNLIAKTLHRRLPNVYNIFFLCVLYFIYHG